MQNLVSLAFKIIVGNLLLSAAKIALAISQLLLQLLHFPAAFIPCLDDRDRL